MNNEWNLGNCCFHFQTLVQTLSGKRFDPGPSACSACVLAKTFHDLLYLKSKYGRQMRLSTHDNTQIVMHAKTASKSMSLAATHFRSHYKLSSACHIISRRHLPFDHNTITTGKVMMIACVIVVIHFCRAMDGKPVSRIYTTRCDRYLLLYANLRSVCLGTNKHHFGMICSSSVRVGTCFSCWASVTHGHLVKTFVWH